MSASFIDIKNIQNSDLKRIDLSHASVLIVDDKPANLEAAKEMLKPYGLHLYYVKNGKEAVDLIRACGEAVRADYLYFEAVFMDHLMPDMNRAEAVRIIREEIDTNYARNVPIISLAELDNFPVNSCADGFRQA